MSLTPPAPPPSPAPDDAGAATTRREFAAAIALTALGACVPRAVTAPAAVVPAPPAPVSPASATGAAGRAPDPVAQALVAVVTARYGADVAPAEQRASFADAVARTVELSRRLRGTPVANGVDPFASFCPTAAAGGRRAP